MLPEGYRKKSFLEFGLSLDVDRLVAEYRAIPPSAWASSYWGNVHCSIGMLLLRGGSSGTSEDFFSEENSDSPLLENLPAIAGLIDADGPFGQAEYAFLFRMEPDGVTLQHRDLMEKWKDMYRIHVPILTNPDAYLISHNRSLHFAVGSAWSFDNFSNHGVVNGSSERVHLIFDIPFNERLREQIDLATFHKGKEYIEHVRRIADKRPAISSYPGDPEIRAAVSRLQEQGLDEAAIADFMNEKGIPTRQYTKEGWKPDLIREFL